MELERVVCRVKEADVEKKTLETRVNELSEALLGAEEAFREADKVAYELRAELGAAEHSHSAQEVRLKELEAEVQEAKAANAKLSQNLNAKMQEQMIWRVECTGKLEAAEQNKADLERTIASLLDQSKGEGAAVQELASRLAAAEADNAQARDQARQTQTRLESVEEDMGRLEASKNVSKPRPDPPSRAF